MVETVLLANLELSSITTLPKLTGLLNVSEATSEIEEPKFFAILKGIFTIATPP